METALQQLQNWINGEAAKRHALASWKTFTAIELLDKIQSLIPAEKEQHIKTYQAAQDWATNYDKNAAEQYYKQTYQSK